MKQWWLNRTPEERTAVTAGAVAVALLLFYLAIWLPLQHGVDNKRSLAQSQAETLVWMQAKAQELQRLARIPKQNQQASSNEALLTLVDRTAKQNRLREPIQRIKPDGSDKVQLWIEGAPFDLLMGWLIQLETAQGINVESLNIDRTETSGLVNARINLQRIGK